MWTFYDKYGQKRVTTPGVALALIKNADIDPAAAISKSKLAALAIVDADVSAISPSKITGTAVVTADARLSDTRTPTDSSVTRAKMAVGNKTTISALSGGPPGSPTTGDIWIATGVDANGTNWMFYYNGASGSAYKWEFIGGGKLIGTTSVTVPRAGDYLVEIGSQGQFANIYQQLNAVGSPAVTLYAYMNSSAASGYDSDRVNGLTASQVLTQTQAGAAPVRPYTRIQPIRIS